MARTLRPRRPRNRQELETTSDVPEEPNEAVVVAEEKPRATTTSSGRAAATWLAMLGALVFVMWKLYCFQTESLPVPVSERAAGIRGFSEERAYKHVQALASLGPHPLGSDALNHALQYVLDQVTDIQETANSEVEVEIDDFHAAPGVVQLQEGLFKGRSLVYSGLKHVVVRLHPKYDDDALENAILVSSHVDTVITAEGAGDCSSCVGVMLELLRALSHWAQGFRHSIIFLFNTGEEEGLIGAHSFMTQHPWRDSIRGAVDLEAMGVGGKSILFQVGRENWFVETFAKVAKNPATMILAQDIFHSGLVKSATDFQIFREVAGLSGLDFAYMENAGVYHTKNDKLQLLRPGSLQHSGDNMLPFLREVATNPDFGKVSPSTPIVYWDILGMYMVTYTQNFARVLHHSIMYQLGVLQMSAIVLNGVGALISASLAFLTIILTWCGSLGFAVVVAFVVHVVAAAAVPFFAFTGLVIPLYCASAAMGALVGHHLGRKLLVRQLEGDVVEAERWLYKAAIMQWVLLLGLTTWVGAGASYLPLAWVLGPTIAYGILEVRLSPRQAIRPLRQLTFWLGVLVPAVLTSLPAFHLPRMLISMLVNFDRNPGALPEWLGNVMIAMVCATVTTLLLVYLLPYVHRSAGGLALILGTLGTIFLISLAAVALHLIPAFTADAGRAINVAHVIHTDDKSSFLSLASLTMGSLDAEAAHMNDSELVCNRAHNLDFVTYDVKYGCQKPVPMEAALWDDRPSLSVVKDDLAGDLAPSRVTVVRLSTAKAFRWSLAVNSNKIARLQLVTSENSSSQPELIPATDISSGMSTGWYYIQGNTVAAAAGDSSSMLLMLHWSSENATTEIVGHGSSTSKEVKLVKLRTDVDVTTREAAKMLRDVPDWCLNFGKSTSPYPLAYLASLPVDLNNYKA